MTARALKDCTLSASRPGALVSYKVFSKGRFIGESQLDWIRADKRVVNGDFLPTEIGEQLMPVLTGPSRVALEQARALSLRGAAHVLTADEIEAHHADLLEACTHQDSLELELYGPDKRLIPTEWIAIRDCELMLAWSEGVGDDLPLDIEDPELAAAIEHDLALLEEEFDFDDSVDPVPADNEAWRDPQPYPRYQISVCLVDGSSIE
jgi:hypothetical protein